MAQKDCICLQEGWWLNDNIIDFWMLWITWMESQPDSLICSVTTHLYSKLEREGVDAILDWSTSKDIDVLEKRIFILIH
jgi:Ulp1 family protease